MCNLEDYKDVMVYIVKDKALEYNREKNAKKI